MNKTYIFLPMIVYFTNCQKSFNNILVADLDFMNNPEFIFQAKIGIFSASLFSGFFWYFWLKAVSRKEVE